MVQAPAVDLSQFKTGKKAPRIDRRTLKVEDYVDLSVFPGYPKTQKWDHGITDFGMMLNDQLGDCVIAAMGHATQILTANNAGEVTVPDSAVLKGYEDVGGYRPGDPNTDQGCDMLTALNYWRQTGIAGHKIGAFATVNPKNINMVKAVIELFGFIYIGVALPISAQNQRVWKVASGPNGQAGSWGGHCITVPDYSSTEPTCITWAHLLSMTDGFFEKYTDEAYAVLSPEWVNGQNVAPNGVNLAQLQTDLSMVTG